MYYNQPQNSAKQFSQKKIVSVLRLPMYSFCFEVESMEIGPPFRSSAISLSPCVS